MVLLGWLGLDLGLVFRGRVRVRVSINIRCLHYNSYFISYISFGRWHYHRLLRVHDESTTKKPLFIMRTPPKPYFNWGSDEDHDEIPYFTVC